jgi:hypothetical protein
MQRLVLFLSAAGAALALGLPLTGCDGGGDGDGGSGGDGGAGGSGPTVAEACAGLSSAVCGQIETCSPFLLGVTYGDRVTCEARVGARCDDPTELMASNLTAADIAACAGAYEARTCADLFSAAPAECRVPGDKDDGATCATAAECKGNLCETGSEGACGVCATPLAEGAACAPATDTCAPGLYCNAALGICDKPAQSGEACDPENLCAAGLSCNSGECGPTLGIGADCANGEVCDFAAGLICFALDSTCRKVGIAKLGEFCGFDNDTGEVFTCEADSRCDSVTEKCVARPKEGEACTIDPDSGEGDCAAGFVCIGGTCAAELPQCE